MQYAPANSHVCRPPSGRSRRRSRRLAIPPVALGWLTCLALALCALTVACSSSPAPCGKSPACASPAACFDDGAGGGPSCHRVCTRQTDCDFNSYCNDGIAAGQPHNWCVASTNPIPRQDGGSGQWGAACSAGCDAADGFACYGLSPTDANAFCTVFDCAADTDCPGGWWCATVNAAPNYAAVTRSFGPTRAVCLPRQYCAPCTMDHDCSPSADGTPQHCTQDTGGQGFCTPQCASNTNCPLDATCTLQWGVCGQMACSPSVSCPVPETCMAGACRLPCAKDADCPTSNGMPQHCAAGGYCSAQACVSDDECPATPSAYQHCNQGACVPECAAATDCNPATGDQACVPFSVCVPRAGTCVGDHGFCSPCRSDADCSKGYCLNASYSTERFCSQAMATGGACTSNGPSVGSCPMLPSTANYKGIGCTTLADKQLAPPNQCYGVVSFGRAQGQVQYAAGCWTVNR